MSTCGYIAHRHASSLHAGLHKLVHLAFPGDRAEPDCKTWRRAADEEACHEFVILELYGAKGMIWGWAFSVAYLCYIGKQVV